jgi:serine protease
MPDQISRPRSYSAAVLLALTLVVSMCLAAAAHAQATDRYIIQYKAGKSAAVASKMAVGKRTARFRHVARTRLMAANLTRSEVIDLIASPYLERLQFDQRRYSLAESTPYGIDLIQAHAAQLDVSTSVPRKVCIIDSGYDKSHPDLPSSAAVVTGEAQPSTGAWDAPGDSHGTHVAGTIAAVSNDIGVVGVDRNPGLSIHVVKVFDDDGQWTWSSDLIAALDSCVNAGSNVINMSLGGGYASPFEEQAFAAAAAGTSSRPGVLSIAAAGNSGDSSLSYPASYASVVSVAAVDSQKELAGFSTRNEFVELAAPGVAVLSTVLNGDYAYYSGTSMATPHVVGAASLLWGLHPDCTAVQIRNAFALSAEDLGSSGRDSNFGHGLIRTAEADDLLRSQGCDGIGEPPEPEPEPEPDVPDLGNGDTVSAMAQAAGEASYFRIPLTEGARELSVTLSGGSGDADLYLMRGARPTTGSYDCRSWIVGNEEFCGEPDPGAPVDYFVMIHAYAAFEGANLSVSYLSDDDGGGTPPNEAPVASIVTSASGGPAPLVVVFDGTSSTDDQGIVAWEWQFQDAPPLFDEPVVERTFTEPGDYMVGLVVTDAQGESSTASVIITVEAPPEAEPISLELKPRRHNQRMRLTWSGANGRRVEVFRDGEFLRRTRNDGRWVDRSPTPTAEYQICDEVTCSEVIQRPDADNPQPITLALVSRRNNQRVRLEWGNASGRRVEVRRDGELLRRTRNDGRWVDRRPTEGATYQICDAFGCSEEVQRP